MFNSRNKDNKDIPGFQQRQRSFLTNKPLEEIYPIFESFSKKGLPNEMSRMYVSVNDRNESLVKKNLQIKLIQEDNIDLTKMDSILVSIAGKPECSKTKRWLFDYDDEETRLEEFLQDLKSYSGLEESQIQTHKTPNGHAIVIDRGFDTRQLLDKWSNVELKRDSFLCIKWEYNLEPQLNTKLSL